MINTNYVFFVFYLFPFHIKTDEIKNNYKMIVIDVNQ